ncbi:hypothetical protein GOP47_0017085 [Adiantum capillus-veneris]|uniref:Cytochrome P450 n=1 Tax=Adiantum capillus-veneris TaxID=13818 RepID=A0A9D4ZCR7_ADICA|nr:hypothetical protein GOP47_0017085 [Adiantum capillus-veneris]
MLLTLAVMVLSLCSYVTLASRLGYTPHFTLALLAALPILFFKYLSALKMFMSSFRMATFFKWHGPTAFLLLREKLSKGDETFPIGKHNLVVFNLNIIKHCLVLKAYNYDKGGRAARLMGEVVGPRGILGALDEDDHVPSHQVLNPHTKQAERIQDFEDLVLEETDNKVKEWAELVAAHGGKATEVDLYVDMNEIFFKVLYKFAFGIELTKEKFRHVHHLISQLERYSAVVGFVPARLLPMYKLYRSDVPGLVKGLNKVVEEIIEEGGAGSPLAELQEAAAGVDGVQLRDTVKNLLFAGATTAANSLGWAVHLVTRDSKWGERAAKAATAKDLTFFKNVCLETNRMYPQANVITRRAKSDDYVDGFGPIPKGRVLVVPIIALHYHPVYYKNPQAFNPDRWAEGQKAPPLMSYIPFTAGPRQCIGQSLFNRAGPPLLMRLYDAFSFQALQSYPTPKWPNAVLPPNAGGFRMLIRPSA